VGKQDPAAQLRLAVPTERVTYGVSVQSVGAP